MPQFQYLTPQGFSQSETFPMAFIIPIYIYLTRIAASKLVISFSLRTRCPHVALQENCEFISLSDATMN